MEVQSLNLKITKQNALTLALNFITTTLSITDSVLERKAGMNRVTLRKIRSGENLKRKHEEYMTMFVRILDKRRRMYQQRGETEKEEAVKDIMLDLLLVEFGIPTHQERRRQEILDECRG